MTCRAVGRGRLVEEHHPALNRSLDGMTRRTCDLFMASFQGECGLVVIEERWLPLVRIVAGAAILSALPKLACVRILMAFNTDNGGGIELHVTQGQFHVWRPVAIDACDRAMCAEEWEPRLGMIKL